MTERVLQVAKVFNFSLALRKDSVTKDEPYFSSQTFWPNLFGISVKSWPEDLILHKISN